MYRASPDAKRPGDLQDADALRKLLSHLAFGRAVYLRPAEPHALGDGALETCFDSLANHDRSNSAKAPVTWKTSLPIGVVVSIACWSGYKSTPHASRCCITIQPRSVFLRRELQDDEDRTVIGTQVSIERMV